MEGVRKSDDCGFADKIVFEICPGLNEDLIEGVDDGSIDGVVVSP